MRGWKDLLLSTAGIAALMSGVNAARAADGGLAITTYQTTQPVSTLTDAVQSANSGITILSSSFIGISGQSATYTGLNLPSSVAAEPTITAPNGVLLTNGSADLPLTNTSTAFSHATNTGSNAELTALIGANTFDQNVLTMTFTLTDPTAKSVTAGFVYGSDEYPEFAAEGYTDAFGFFVDGKNYAYFPNGSPVAITSANISNFNDNNTKNANGATAYGIEYDGISNLLTVVGLLNTSLATHTLTIAVADVNDTSVDSGAFIGNLHSSSATGGGIVAPPTINTTGGDISANVFSLSSTAANQNPVVFQGGTLRMIGGSFAGNVITAPVTLSATNGTVDTSPASGGFSGVVAGPGSLTIIGGNTFSLTGANTYTGGTILNGGTLLVGSDTALGTGALAMADGTTLQETVGVSLANAIGITGNATIETSDTLGAGDGLIANGVVSGTGTLVKTGASGLRLAGANTYSGGTIIADGHIGIASNAALGTGTVTFAGGFLVAHADGFTVSNDAILQSDGKINTQSFGLTYAGVISGAGSLTKNGTGTLTLSGANSYSGGTEIVAGAVAVTNKSALGTGALTFGTSGSGNTGTLQAAADGLSLANAVTLAADGTVDTQDFGLTVSGTVTGSGQLTKLGAGTLAPTGANSYGGGTLINAGTVIVSLISFDPATKAIIDGGEAKPSTQASVPDAVTLVNNGGTILSSVGYAPVTLNGGSLQFNLAYIGEEFANRIAIGPNGGRVDSHGTDEVDLDGGLFDSAAGTGTLVFANSGTGGSGHIDFSLFRTSSFSGGSIISNNTYVVQDSDGSLGTGALQVDAGGVFDLGAFNQSVTRLTGAGSIVASGDTGPGILGTLTVQSGAFSGTLGDGTVTDPFRDVVLHGALGLTKVSDGSAAGGTLTLSGTSTYSGPTTVSGGTLQAGSVTAFSASSAFTVGAGATLDLAAFNNSVGSLAGGGTVTNSGVATAALTAGGNNSSTTFSGLVNDGAGALKLVKAGTGTLTLSGPNSYSGGTKVQAGTIAIGDNAALGTGGVELDDGTTLAFTASGLVVANPIDLPMNDPTIDTGSGFETLSAPITGPAALTKLGSGTLDLTGASTYTGATEVAAGTLLVDGSIVSTVTIDSGATLGGMGTVGSFTALNGSSVAPSLGKVLTVTGNATFDPGSTYQVTVNADGTSNKLSVGGKATIGGAGLSVLAGSGTFGAATYTLLSAVDGVTGTFSTVNTAAALALLSPSVGYTADSVTLTLAPVAFPSVAATPNQAATASAIQALGKGSPLYDAVVTQNTAAGAQQAFAAASGVTHANQPSLVLSNNRVMTTLLIDRLWDVGGNGLSAREAVDQFAPDRMPALVRCYGPMPDPVPAAPQRAFTAWGEGFGTFGHTDATANAGPQDRSLGGFVLGIDTPIDHILGTSWRTGVAVGYTDTFFRTPVEGGSGTVQGVFGSLYSGAQYGAIDVRVGATGGGTFTDATRNVAFPGFLETEKSFNRGYTAQGFGEVGYRFKGAAGTIEPIVSASIVHLHQDGFSEKGGAAALTVADQDNDLGSTSVGVRGEVAPIKDVPLLAHALLAWQHTIGNVSPASTLAFEANPSQTFSVIGAPIDRDALAAEAALDYRASTALDVGLSYSGIIGRTASDHSVKGRFEYRF